MKCLKCDLEALGKFDLKNRYINVPYCETHNNDMIHEENVKEWDMLLHMNDMTDEEEAEEKRKNDKLLKSLMDDDDEFFKEFDKFSKGVIDKWTDQKIKTTKEQ